MKKLSLLVFGLIMSHFISAQSCSIDPSVTTKGAHPSVLTPGTALVAYDQTLTIVFPLDTLGYPITNAKIESITVPSGFSYELLDDVDTFNPQTNQRTCIRVFGTSPIATSNTVSINVTLFILGNMGIADNFRATFEIENQESSLDNAGFFTNRGEGCAPLTVNFQNHNLSNSSTMWNFGNGQSYWGNSPEDIVFDTPGVYPVTYTGYTSHDTTYSYILKQMVITYANPDVWLDTWLESSTPQFKLLIYENGTKIHETGVKQQNLPTTFNLNIPMNPTKQYRVDFVEIDGASWLPVNQTICGQHILPFQESGTVHTPLVSTGNFQIQVTPHYPTPSLIVADTIRVYENVQTPVIVNTDGTLTATTPGAISYKWYKNDVVIPDEITDTYVATVSANYKVKVSNEHCTSTSTEVPVAICLTNYTPAVVTSGANQLTLSNPLAGHTIQWFANNNEVTGATAAALNMTSSSSFTVKVTDVWGCTYTSAAYNAYLAVQKLDPSAIIAYPNPTTGNVTFTAQDIIQEVIVMDPSGRIVLTNANDSNTAVVNLENMPSGYYMISIQTESGSINKKIVKQ